MSVAWQDDTVDVQQFVAEQGTALYWLPRYSATPLAPYGLAPSGSDPHSPTNVPRCPVCWNGTVQRAASSVCTTCYGTGWQGGFAPAVSLTGVVLSGVYTLKNQESGEILTITGTVLYTNPADGDLMPQDIVAVANNTAVRYLAGELVQAHGFLSSTVVRVSQLLPIAADAVWQKVPL